MTDPSLSLVQVDGAGSYVYALRTASGQAWNWTLNTWEPAGTAPSPAHLRALTAVTWGSAAWSQDVIPAVAPTSSQVLAVLWTAGTAGAPGAWQGTAVLQQSAQNTTIFQGRS